MRKLCLLIALLAALPVSAQNMRYDAPFPSVTSQYATPFLVANTPQTGTPQLAVCGHPANQVPCTNYVTTYTQAGAACPNGAQDTPQPQPSSCQSGGDAQGNIGFWAPPGTYDYTVTVNNVSFGPYTITLFNGSQNTGQVGNITTYGATCTGADAAPAIRSAMLAYSYVTIPPCYLGGVLTPYTVCSMDSRVWNGLQFMFWLTAGQAVQAFGGAQLKVGNGCLNTAATNQGGNVFFSDIQDRVALENVYIDMNGANNLIPNCGGCYHPSMFAWFEGGNYDTVDSVSVNNASGVNMVVNTGAIRGVHGSNFTVKSSIFHNGGTYITGNSNQVDFSFLYSEATYSKFENNHIFNDGDTTVLVNSGGIEIHGNYSEAAHNTIEYSSPGFFVCSPTAGIDITDVKIHDNILNNVVAGVAFFPVLNSDFRKISITDNKITVRKNPNFTANPAWGIQMNRADNGSYNYQGILRNSEIMGNYFTTGGTPASDGSTGMRLTSLNEVLIASNHCFNLGGACIGVAANPYNAANVTIQGNDAYNVGQTFAPYVATINFDTGNLALQSWLTAHTYTVLASGALYVLPNPLNGYIFKYTASGVSGVGLPNCTSVGQVITDGTATLTCTAPWTVSGITIVNNTVSWPTNVGGYVADVTDTPNFSTWSANQYSNFQTNNVATNAVADMVGTTAALASFAVNQTPTLSVYNANTVSGYSNLHLRSSSNQSGLSLPVFDFKNHLGNLTTIFPDTGDWWVYEDPSFGYTKCFNLLDNPGSNTTISGFCHHGNSGGTYLDSYIGPSPSSYYADFSAAGESLAGHLNQSASGKFGGSCGMSAATTCTFSIAAAFNSAPITFVSLDAVSTAPATAISAKCSVSSTTVTITAGASNSLTWDCLLIGNPN